MQITHLPARWNAVFGTSSNPCTTTFLILAHCGLGKVALCCTCLLHQTTFLIQSMYHQLLHLGALVKAVLQGVPKCCWCHCAPTPSWHTVANCIAHQSKPHNPRTIEAHCAMWPNVLDALANHSHQIYHQ